MDNSAPLVSVIAVNYNHSRYVIETLESIRSQTWQNFELIFCDDASRDQSVSIALDWLKQHQIPAQLVLHQENQGLCKTLNEAVRLCRGKYIQGVACDDVLHRDKFEKQVQLFENGPESVAAVFSDANLIDQTGKPRKPFRFYKRYAVPNTQSRESLYEQLLKDNCLSALSAMMRRQALLDVGLYDENLPYEDHDMWLRMLRQYDLVVTDDATADYRIHGNNMHRSQAFRRQANQSRYKIIRKHLDHPLGKIQFQRDILHMIRNDTLCTIDPQDLVTAEFQLQEIADLFQRHCPQRGKWLEKQVRSMRDHIRQYFQRKQMPLAH